ncbi:MAG TPA: hypothetical protein DD424_12215 [Porphyromonadaceae bacterium]|jgi:hypothetical protein|nr:hypothetical protein EEL39_03990 [Muribaculaceae bacterium Isolate-080 (Janvier)]HBN64678.1 hypothetical protein [Porphyromonadaceae bacterium]
MTDSSSNHKRIPKTTIIMSERKTKSGTTLWLAIGVVVLIILLMLWLTIADLLGDTDVAAFIAPI